MILCRVSFVFVIFLCFGFSLNNAFGKCPFETYTIEGYVLAQDGKPIKGANVAIFFNDANQGNFVLTSENGNFKVKWLFDTYLETIGGYDNCSKGPNSLTIVVCSEGYFVKKIRYELNGDNVLQVQENLQVQDILLKKISFNTLNLLRLEKATE